MFHPTNHPKTRAQPLPHGREPRSNNPLFEALVCETHHAALMTAVTASCIHAAGKGLRGLDQPTLERFMPVEPAILLSLSRRSLLDIEPLVETQAVVEGYFLSLEVLRRLLRVHAMDATEIGLARADVLHVRRLSTAAAASCHEAVRAVRALEIETPGRLPDIYCDHAAALCRLLLAAERGDTPCLDERGEPMVPVLPQRRRSMRRSLGQNCRVEVRGALIPAMAKDISESGLGLLRVPYLVPDQGIAVQLASGRRFEGQVVWCRDEAAGVRFMDPLSANDPILAL